MAGAQEPALSLPKSLDFATQDSTNLNARSYTVTDLS